MFEYTKKKFAKDIIKSARHFQPDCNPIYHESESHIKFQQTDSNDETIIRLDNVYQQWKDLPRKERRNKINAFVEPMFHPVERSEDQRMAMFRLRARSVEEITNRQLIPFDKELKPTLYHRGALVLELVEDSEAHVSLVAQENLDALQLDEEQAFNMAAAAMVRDTGANQWKELGDVWYSTYSDDYDFARLVAAGNDAHLPFNTGAAIAYAPSHAVCIISNKHDADTLALIIDIGDKMSDNQRLLSRRLWTLDTSGNWVYFENDSDAQVTNIVKMQEVLDCTNNYNEQKNLLEKIHENEQTDVFVASYVGMQNQDDEIVSMCTYTLNLPTLLPETDLVNVYDHESESILCSLPWQEFCAILGQSIKKHDEYVPTRYSVPDALPNAQISTFKQQ